MKLMIFVAIVVFSSASILQAVSKRVNQIPNGSKYQCLNCHKSSTGGSRNTFGTEVENNFLDGNGNVIWNAQLAGKDSDGDTYPNGTELQDPNGTWVMGSASPGDQTYVSNPGVKSSIPTSVNDELTNFQFSITKIKQNSLNQNYEIDYKLNFSGLIFIAVYDINGALVKNLKFESQYQGEYSVEWDGTSNGGSQVPSGTYFIDIKLNEQNLVKKINIAR